MAMTMTQRPDDDEDFELGPEHDNCNEIVVEVPLVAYAVLDKNAKKGTRTRGQLRSRK